ncbi:MAG: bifunctional folylpolyglutamate synthase/dihydrofolate synthase [Oligoflexia bacterium]|nr:bifunctional folylpolyglutamate synthase/dihydrofolate synthase [Oligoflexia bacterium]
MINHPILSASARHGVRLGLTRMRSFLDVLGSPEQAVPVLHIAGTNGKGSVVAMVSAVLGAHGLVTGELTSPHLQQVNERICVGGQPIDDASLDALLTRLSAAGRAFMEGHDQDVIPLTYFELITAAGFLHLAQQGIDVSLVEVGLGGRLDATNLVAPVATAIVSIGIEHTAALGPDEASIAAEKAGIIKPGVPIVVGPLSAAASRVVRAMAAERRAPLLEPGSGYHVSASRDGTAQFSMGDVQLHDLPIGLAGEHQVANAGVALALCQLFLGPQRQLDPVRTAAALGGVRHPGRLEWIGPDLLLDAAHNPAGARTLATYLHDLPRDRPRTLLLGVSENKDLRSMLVALVGELDRVIATHCAHPRAMPAGQIAEALIGVDLPILPAGPVEDALPLARSQDGLVIVAGSIFLVGAVRELVGAQ